MLEIEVGYYEGLVVVDGNSLWNLKRQRLIVGQTFHSKASSAWHSVKLLNTFRTGDVLAYGKLIMMRSEDIYISVEKGSPQCWAL